MGLTNYGHVYGRPRIKMNYGQSTGKVRQNIRRKTVHGGLKVKKMGVSKQSFGYGK